MTIAPAEDRAAMRRRARRHAIIVTATVLGALVLGLIYYELTQNVEYEATLAVLSNDIATLTVQRLSRLSSKTMLIAQVQAPPGTPKGTFTRKSTDSPDSDSPIIETGRDPTPPPMWKIRVFGHEIMIMSTAVRVGGRHVTYEDKPLEIELGNATR